MDTNKQEWKEKFEDSDAAYWINNSEVETIIDWFEKEVISPLESSIKEKDKEIERLNREIERLNLLTQQIIEGSLNPGANI